MFDNNELLKAYKSGDKNALQKIIESNIGLVIQMARKYAHVCAGRLDYDDLYQEGCIGLIKAANSFEIEQGFQFSTYAFYWIRQRIIRYIEDNKRGIRIPVHMLSKIKAIKENREKLLKTLNRDPSVSELAAYTKQDVHELLFILNLDADISSLDAQIFSDSSDDLTIMDSVMDNNTIDPEENAINSALRKDLVKLIDELLNDVDKKIIRLRYGFDGEAQSLCNIGNMLGKSGERIREIEVRSLRKLRYSPYIRKIIAERQLEKRNNYYRGGSDPVAESAIDRVDSDPVAQIAIDKVEKFTEFDNSFYEWHYNLIAEKIVIKQRTLNLNKDRIKEIDIVLTIVTNALNEMLFKTKDSAAWTIVTGRLNGIPERSVREIIPMNVNYWATEKKAINYIKNYLADRNVLCVF